MAAPGPGVPRKLALRAAVAFATALGAAAAIVHAQQPPAQLPPSAPFATTFEECDALKARWDAYRQPLIDASKSCTHQYWPYTNKSAPFGDAGACCHEYAGQASRTVCSVPQPCAQASSNAWCAGQQAVKAVDHCRSMVRAHQEATRQLFSPPPDGDVPSADRQTMQSVVDGAGRAGTALDPGAIESAAGVVSGRGGSTVVRNMPGHLLNEIPNAAWQRVGQALDANLRALEGLWRDTARLSRGPTGHVSGGAARIPPGRASRDEERRLQSAIVDAVLGIAEDPRDRQQLQRLRSHVWYTAVAPSAGDAAQYREILTRLLGEGGGTGRVFQGLRLAPFDPDARAPGGAQGSRSAPPAGAGLLCGSGDSLRLDPPRWHATVRVQATATELSLEFGAEGGSVVVSVTPSRRCSWRFRVSGGQGWMMPVGTSGLNPGSLTIAVFPLRDGAARTARLSSGLTGGEIVVRQTR